jgi:hypothetical protein
MATTYATDVKLFNKWSYDDIEVSDISLEVTCSSSCLFILPCIGELRSFVFLLSLNSFYLRSLILNDEHTD